jgi:hypothetical protein
MEQKLDQMEVCNQRFLRLPKSDWVTAKSLAHLVDRMKSDQRLKRLCGLLRVDCDDERCADCERLESQPKSICVQRCVYLHNPFDGTPLYHVILINHKGRDFVPLKGLLKAGTGNAQITRIVEQEFGEIKVKINKRALFFDECEEGDEEECVKPEAGYTQLCAEVFQREQERAQRRSTHLPAAMVTVNIHGGVLERCLNTCALQEQGVQVKRPKFKDDYEVL